jgi:hypothetical protein
MKPRRLNVPLGPSFESSEPDIRLATQPKIDGQKILVTTLKMRPVGRGSIDSKPD